MNPEMPNTQREMVQELYQAVIGIADNPECNGLIGDMAEIKELLQKQNGRVRDNEKSISRLNGVVAGLSIFITLGTLAIVALGALGVI